MYKRQGITEVIEQNGKALEKYTGDGMYVKYILDLRDFPDSPYSDRVVHDINIIAKDPEVSIVCEAMGGVTPAYAFSVMLMEHGKSVVTSNKELVAKRGVELCETAEKNGVSYMSVSYTHLSEKAYKAVPTRCCYRHGRICVVARCKGCGKNGHSHRTA